MPSDSDEDEYLFDAPRSRSIEGKYESPQSSAPQQSLFNAMGLLLRSGTKTIAKVPFRRSMLKLAAGFHETWCMIWTPYCGWKSPLESFSRSSWAVKRPQRAYLVYNTDFKAFSTNDIGTSWNFQNFNSLWDFRFPFDNRHSFDFTSFQDLMNTVFALPQISVFDPLYGSACVRFSTGVIVAMVELPNIAITAENERWLQIDVTGPKTHNLHKPGFVVAVSCYPKSGLQFKKV